jgi:hypothetical protein
MIIFLSIVGAFLVWFIVQSRRYNNPYRLIFIFGKKGAGKSLYMVKQMMKYLKKGWTVYTDIVNCNLPGVRIMNAMDLSEFAPVENSAIFLDEAGILFDNRNFKNFNSGLRDFFKLQRKYKCRVFLNSQSFDIDKKIRDVTDHMGLIVSVGNVFSIYRPIRRSITLTQPSAEAESRIADKLSFESLFKWQITYLPKYFKYFDSFAAPERPPLPFNEIVADLTDKNVLRSLRRQRPDNEE